jgi:ribonucleoside-diphosphate reductase alpha chain
MSNDNEIDYFGLNAMLNLFDEDGKLQLEKDKQAVRQYFLENVNI